MFNHFREELRDAAKGERKAEEALRARNVILIAAAAIAPLTALMWIALLLLWDNVGDPPGLMYDAALLYPVLAVGAAMISMPLHRRGRFFLSCLISALPLLCVLAYLGAAVAWAAG
ncbi:MAG: hypothetical protein RIB45_09610 [Marivibrio sp.]|uniref:hypothetical protein n=1 Tax=Marivibrio sp. TaxID=2039719 RepID=UPI0032EAEF68